MHCICHLHFALRERPITITIRGFHSFRRLKDVAEREREVDIFPARQTWRSHFKDERLGDTVDVRRDLHNLFLMNLLCWVRLGFLLELISHNVINHKRK